MAAAWPTWHVCHTHAIQHTDEIPTHQFHRASLTKTTTLTVASRPSICTRVTPHLAVKLDQNDICSSFAYTYDHTSPWHVYYQNFKLIIIKLIRFAKPQIVPVPFHQQLELSTWMIPSKATPVTAKNKTLEEHHRKTRFAFRLGRTLYNCVMLALRWKPCTFTYISKMTADSPLLALSALIYFGFTFG